MSVIKQFVHERELGVDFYNLFIEIAKQEDESLRDVAAFFYRNRSKLVQPQGMNNSYWSKNFICYQYNKLKGFDPFPNEHFQDRCIDAIKAIAEGFTIVDEDINGELGFTFTHRIDVISEDYRGFFSNFMFRKDEISKFLDELGVKKTHSLITDDEVKAADSSPHLEEITWGTFAGKDTALMLIAGMATALEKSSAKYSRGGKPNKSAIERAAREAINDFGHGTVLSERALTNLLAEALRTNLRPESFSD